MTRFKPATKGMRPPEDMKFTNDDGEELQVLTQDEFVALEVERNLQKRNAGLGPVTYEDAQYGDT